MNTPAEIKACCAASYGNDAVALVLGESYHPGGLSLTRCLAEQLRLRSGQRVADIAAGPGATARLAADYDVTVDGVDLGQSTIERARTATADAGLAAKVRFHLGDAERIPLPDSTCDAVVCECAFCTFPDKATAAAEFARVLRPGGRIGITDVTVAEGGLPVEMTTLAAWVACIADARLRVLRMTASTQLAEAGVNSDAVPRYAALARQAVVDGLIGYGLLVAEKPSDGPTRTGSG